MEESQPQPVLDRKNVIKVMWESGMTSGEIAKEVGVSRSAVMGVVFRLRKKNILSNENPIKVTPRKPRQKKNTNSSKQPNVKSNVTNEEYGLAYLFKDPKEGKTVFKIEGAECRYIIKRGVFCAKPGHSMLKPWCEEHYPLIYVKSRYSGNSRNRLLFGITRKARY